MTNDFYGSACPGAVPEYVAMLLIEEVGTCNLLLTMLLEYLYACYLCDEGSLGLLGNSTKTRRLRHSQHAARHLLARGAAITSPRYRINT